MKKAVFVIIMLAFLTPGVADACVGKKLIVGVTESTESKVLAEVLATLVNERTGTTVEVYFYDDVEQIYDAVKEKVVDISIENTTRAMNLNESTEYASGK
jgi:osmoprotectant transport system substrate-binding protein